jgi:hypothetical protein
MERGSFRTLGIRLDDEDVRVSGGWGKVPDIRAGSSSREGAQPASPFGGASLVFEESNVGIGSRGFIRGSCLCCTSRQAMPGGESDRGESSDS